jgi:hypothetical protein
MLRRSPTAKASTNRYRLNWVGPGPNDYEKVYADDRRSVSMVFDDHGLTRTDPPNGTP